MSGERHPEVAAAQRYRSGSHVFAYAAASSGEGHRMIGIDGSTRNLVNAITATMATGNPTTTPIAING